MNMNASLKLAPVVKSRIRQLCNVKTSMVTPTFNYVFIIFLTRFIGVSSFFEFTKFQNCLVKSDG